MVNITVVGRLGNKPEIRVTSKGNEFVTFNLAVDDYNKGEKETTWFTVVDFTPNAKRRAEHLNKGSLVYIQGTERVRQYEDKDNKSRIARDIQVSFLDFISTGTKQEQQENVTCGTLNEQQPAMAQRPTQQPVQQQFTNPQSSGAPIPPQAQTIAQQPVQQQAATAAAGGYNNLEDDLPF